MADVLIMAPQFQEKMWGGNQLRAFFGFDVAKNTGECWGISAQAHGITAIKNGRFAGQLLTTVWQKHPELFGMPHVKEFPLLVKILDAKLDLSLQVHPSDEQVKQLKLKAPAAGKSECWYILAAKPNAMLYLGHNAKSHAELVRMIDEHRFDELVKKIPVKAGDFINVPATTLHSLGAGIIALEIQQSSDTTYRVYDFDRIDETTHKKRALQLDLAKQVITTPQPDLTVSQTITRTDGGTITHLLDSPKFNVAKIAVKTSITHHPTHPYTLLSVIAGEGTLTVEQTNYQLHAGMFLLLAANVKQYRLAGKVTVIKTTPGIEVM